MTFRGVIDKCDSLFPNQFSDSEKLSFCNELAALIHANYIKSNKKTEVEGGESAALPDGVTADRVRAVYFDGVLQAGTSIKDIFARSGGHRVTVEYADIPQYVIDDALPVSAPFDELFTYWLLAKICLHNEDAEGYNNYMSLYNALMLEFKKSFGSSNIDGAVRFGNLW